MWNFAHKVYGLFYGVFICIFHSVSFLELDSPHFMRIFIDINLTPTYIGVRCVVSFAAIIRRINCTVLIQFFLRKEFVITQTGLIMGKIDQCLHTNFLTPILPLRF